VVARGPALDSDNIGHSAVNQGETCQELVRQIFKPKLHFTGGLGCQGAVPHAVAALIKALEDENSAAEGTRSFAMLRSMIVCPVRTVPAPRM
jgi:hypothetical protein